MNIIVFAGPTISHEEVKDLVPGANCRPPVARGDVYKAVVGGATTIVIIDGYFDRVPSVWHKEILWALSRKICVLGAASMGALRAAELSGFGMTGVGRVYEAFANGTFEDDDEVALLHAPAEFNYLPITVALVDIRATFNAACREGIIDGSLHDEIISLAKELHYRERTYDRILSDASAFAGPEVMERLREWIRDHKVNQKKEDARELLTRIDSFRSSEQEPRFVSTVYWQQLVDTLVNFREDSLAISDILRELGLRGPGFQHLLRDAQLRTLALREATRLGLQSPLALEQTREHVYAICSISDDDSRSRWMKANDVRSEADLERLLRDEANVRSVSAMLEEETRRVLLENLQLMGLYGSVLARLRDKRRVLSIAPLTDKSDTELILWHFSLARQTPPRDLTHYAETCGYEDLHSFLIALREEYTYAHARG